MERWNVVDNENFKKRVDLIFDEISTVLAKTAGPYGSTTIIERFGESHITKDGLHVLQSIYYNDNTDRNIKELISRISIQVANLVGDGTTSSILVASAIEKELENNSELLNKMMPRELVRIMEECTQIISSALISIATPVDITNRDIYNISYISTNGDEHISEMIQDIYEKTDNPTIEYRKSKTDKSYYEIIDGYKLDFTTYIDAIFVNSDDGICKINKPFILPFYYKIDKDNSWDLITAGITKALKDQRTLVVIAPYYDISILEHIKRVTSYDLKQFGEIKVVFLKISLINDVYKKMYNDFSVMIGGQLVQESDVESFPESSNQEEYSRVLETYLGESALITIDDRKTIVSGLYNRNNEIYEKILLDANNDFKHRMEDYYDRSLTDQAFLDSKNRISRLRGKMGAIYVGGYTSLEQKSKYDLVDDAVKACESAYLYGYVIGCNTIVPHLIKTKIDREYIEKYNPDMNTLLDIIYNAYRNVFGIIMDNKYSFIDFDINYDEVFDHNVSNGVCWDLTSNTYSNNIINSVRTDIEILKGAMSIISLLISSNQYISIPKQ
jgi:chaperonin GroEL